MRKLLNAYVDMYVANDRLRRRTDAAEADWDRWVERVELAKRVDEPELAELARRRALQAAEREIDMRVQLGKNRQRLRSLRKLL